MSPPGRPKGEYGKAQPEGTPASVHGLSALRARLRPAFGTGTMWAAGLAGAGGVVAPGLLAGSAWPPLHARCMAVTALSVSVAIAQARRTLDPAALSMPMLALAAWCLSAAAPALIGGGDGGPWHGALAAVGLLALGLARDDGDTPAPAQHRDRAWTAFAVLALLVALPLLIVPGAVAPFWPWRLDAALVAQYASMFVAWSVAMWRLSRERRRYIRLPVVWGLLVWALGVLASSLWHLSAFRWNGPSAWLWLAAFTTTGVLAALRIWPGRRLRGGP